MDIKELMQQMHDASNEEEKNKISKEIENQFQNLSEEEKQKAKNEFLTGFSNKAREYKEKCEELDLLNQISEIAEFISISSIAKKYFGRSRHWLYQKINGNIVNGKPAKFTQDELMILKNALEDIAVKIQNTSRSIA